MTNQEFETLKLLVSSNDRALLDLAKEVISNDQLDFEEMVLLNAFARNREQDCWRTFKKDVDSMSETELDEYQDLYGALCILIGTVQEKIKAHDKYRDSKPEVHVTD